MKTFLCLLLVIICPNAILADPITEGSLEDRSALEANAFKRDTLLANRITAPFLPPKIDGILDDKLWQEIEYSEGLHQVQPKEFEPATEQTRFWVAYDKDTLYFAVQLYYRHPEQIVAMQPIQSLEFESDDQLHIALDPFNLDRDGYFFQVNANGVLREALISNNPNTGFNDDWTTTWQASSSFNDQGWATEIAIPFKSISFDPSNEIWGFNIGRVIRRKGEFLAWSSRGSDVWEMGPPVMANMGPITDIEQGLGLDIKLSGIAKQNNDSSFKKREQDAEPSVDLFYKPNPALTLAATVNTDFSATTVDDRIVNLSRFDVLFPEKRDFFLQDANQFTFANLNENGMPFFSRAIGQNLSGRPIPLDGGLKITSRTNDYSFGALAIRQPLSTASPASHTTPNEADLFILRGAKNILQESYLGFIYTQGNPNSSDPNEVLGLDLNYNNSDIFGGRQIMAFAWYLQSDNDTNIDNNTAHGLTLGYPNSRYSLIWDYKEIGANFDPAMGFVNRRDIQQHTLSGGFRNYLSQGFIKTYNPSFEIVQVNNTDGIRQSETLTTTPLYLESFTADYVSVSAIRHFERLTEDFNILNNLTVPIGDFDFDRLNVVASTSTVRKFFTSVEFETGDFYNGKRLDKIYSLGLRPWNPLFIYLDYQESKLDLPTGDFTTRLTRLRTELALSRNWAWLALFQYDNVTRELGVNSRVQWMPNTGKELFFVINRNDQRQDDDSLQTVYEDYSLKLSYTLRF